MKQKLCKVFSKMSYIILNNQGDQKMNETNFVKFDNFQSSAIQTLWYSEEKQELIVQYKGGDQYRYKQVTPSEWKALTEAESKGKYLTENIKSKSYQKMVLHD